MRKATPSGPPEFARVAPARVHAVTDAVFDAARRHFDRARRGEADQIELAIAAFAVAPANPALQPLYSVYLGCAHALKGKAAWVPWKKLKFAEHGLIHIDRALATLRPEHEHLLVKGTPMTLFTKIVAAATFISMPDRVFHRRAAGRVLIDQIRRSPSLPSAPPAFHVELEALERRLKAADE
jgi:hypothetical protein